MELDNIKLQTTWNDAAGSINSNFQKIKQALATNGGGGGTADIVVDTAMSDTSENAVQNKVIKAYVDDAINDIDLPQGSEYITVKEGVVSLDVDSQGGLGNTGQGIGIVTIPTSIMTGIEQYVEEEIEGLADDIKANPKTYIQLKTINGMEIYGEGNIAIEGGSGEGTSGLTAINVNSQSFQPDLDGIVTLPNYRPLNYYNQDLAEKVDKVDGKGLSTNDYTTTEKNKLAGIAAGAEVNVQSDWNATSGDAFIKNKPTLSVVATSGSYDDLLDKPTIPVEVTETTVAEWGFTKNTGTYIKPTTGIPKSHLASGVQTSLGLADTALQPSALNDYPTTTEVRNALTNALKNYALAQDLDAVDERLADVEAFFDSKDDTDSLVNKWHEIVNFLDATEGDTLDSILSTYAKGEDLESAVERIAANETTINTHTSQISNHATRLSVVETKATDNATAITNIQKLFTDGKANKAIADGNGNNIVSTYATKTALAATDANVTTNATAISTLKGYFTGGKANNADKLDGYDSSYFATAANLNNLVTRVSTVEGEIDGLQEDNETFMAWYNAVGKYFKYDSVNEAWYLDGDFYTTGQNAAGGVGEEEGSTGGGLDEDQLAEYLTTNKYVTQTDLGALAFKSSLAFSELTSKPTTLSGYGIKDAVVDISSSNYPLPTDTQAFTSYCYANRGWKTTGPVISFPSGSYKGNIQIGMSSDNPRMFINCIYNGEEGVWTEVATALNISDFAVKVGAIAADVDLDDYGDAGVYSFWGNITNSVGGSYGTLLVTRATNKYFTGQLFTNHQGHLFSRMREGSETAEWKDWRTILDDNNYTSYVYSKTDSDAKYVPFAGNKTINGNVTFSGTVTSQGTFQTRYFDFFQDAVRTGGMAADASNVETLYFITKNYDYRTIIHSGNVSKFSITWDADMKDPNTVYNHHVGYGYIGGGWHGNGPAISFGTNLYYAQIQTGNDTETPYMFFRPTSNGVAGDTWFRFIFDVGNSNIDSERFSCRGDFVLHRNAADGDTFVNYGPYTNDSAALYLYGRVIDLITTDGVFIGGSKVLTESSGDGRYFPLTGNKTITGSVRIESGLTVTGTMYLKGGLFDVPAIYGPSVTSTEGNYFKWTLFYQTGNDTMYIQAGKNSGTSTDPHKGRIAFSGYGGKNATRVDFSADATYFNGDMSCGALTAKSTTINGTLAVNNHTDINSSMAVDAWLTVYGLASFNKGIEIASGQSIAFVDSNGDKQYITLDEENGAIKVIGNFFATGQNAAGGAGGEELGMLTSWENPPTNLEGMTLSASLGIDLYNNSKKVLTSWDDIPEEGDEGYEDFVLSEYTVSADLVQTMNDEITTLKNKTTPSAAIIKLTNLCSAYTSGTSGIAYTGSMANFITWTVFNSLRDGIAIKVSDTSSSKRRVWDYSVDYTASGYKFRFTLEDKYVEITSSSTTSFTSSTYTITHNL